MFRLMTSHFLLRAQEKVTKEKATPTQRSPGILPSELRQQLNTDCPLKFAVHLT